MRKLEIADAAVMQVAIRQEIDRSDESRYDHRLHDVLLVASGRSCTEVSQLFGEDATPVQRGVRRFEHRGFGGLRDGERPGRPTSLDGRQWTRLARDLRLRYGVGLGVRQCQRIFGHMGFRLRKPRPQVAQSDPVKVAAFNKTAPPGTAPGR